MASDGATDLSIPEKQLNEGCLKASTPKTATYPELSTGGGCVAGCHTVDSYGSPAGTEESKMGPEC